MTKKAINKKRVIKKMKSVNSKFHWRRSRLKNLLKRDFASRKSEFGRRAQFPESRSRNSLRDRFCPPPPAKAKDRDKTISHSFKVVWIMSGFEIKCNVTIHLPLLPTFNTIFKWKLVSKKKRQSGSGILLWSLKKATQFLKKFINAISSGGEITVVVNHLN